MRWIWPLGVIALGLALFLYLNPPQPDLSEITTPEPAQQFATASVGDWKGMSLSALARQAETKIGAPYQWGGTGNPGYDCSGLIWSAAQDLGFKIPRTASTQLAASEQIDEDAAKNTAGAMVWLRRQETTSKGEAGSLVHVGISTGDGYTIEAWTSRGVTKAPWGWWNRKYSTYPSYFGKLQGTTP